MYTHFLLCNRKGILPLVYFGAYFTNMTDLSITDNGSYEEI